MLIILCNVDHPQFSRVIIRIRNIYTDKEIIENPPDSFILDNIYRIDIVISIFNKRILGMEMLGINNVNIHLAPPWYRGIGGPVHSEVDKRDIYGVVAHLMEEEIDSGKIINSVYFNSSAMSFDEITSKSALLGIELLENVLLNYITNNNLDSVTCCSWYGRARSTMDLSKTIEHKNESYRNKVISYYKKHYGIDLMRDKYGK